MPWIPAVLLGSTKDMFIWMQFPQQASDSSGGPILAGNWKKNFIIHFHVKISDIEHDLNQEKLIIVHLQSSQVSAFTDVYVHEVSYQPILRAACFHLLLVRLNHIKISNRSNQCKQILKCHNYSKTKTNGSGLRHSPIRVNVYHVQHLGAWAECQHFLIIATHKVLVMLTGMWHFFVIFFFMRLFLYNA